jgi:UDP-glucose 4-epimerase
VLDAVDRVTNQTIERRLEARRAGDPAELVSDPSRIRETLPWQPKHADLAQIITHALQWERKLSDLRGE